MKDNVYNVNFCVFGFQTQKVSEIETKVFRFQAQKCLKSEEKNVSENQTVIECLKSIQVQISDTYSTTK